MGKEQVDWKAKYKEAAMELERLENRQEEEMLRAVVTQLTLGLQGQTPELDQALDDVRSHLHQSKRSLSRTQVKQIEQGVRQLDGSRQKAYAAILQVLKEWVLTLRRYVASDSPASAQLYQLESGAPDAAETLYQLPEHLAQLLELQTTLSLVSPDQGASAMAAEPVSVTVEQQLDMISTELIQLIGVLNLTAQGRRTANELIRGIETGLTLTSVVSFLARITELIQQATDTSNEDFESYLLNLNAQLAEVQTFLEESHSEQQVAGVTHRELDMKVRSDVSHIHQAVKNSDDLGALKVSVAKQLAGIVRAMDHFRRSEEEREGRLQQRYDTLMSRVSEMELETQRATKRMEEERQKARTDALTGLPNRAAYDDHLQKEFERWKRYQQGFALAIADLDHFKQINDNYGHLAGDKVLKLIARVMSKHLRASDFIARFGGEEFVILMPSTNAQEGVKALEKLRASIRQSPFNFHGKPVTISVSFGVTETQQADTPDLLFGRADRALYQAKEKGRDCVCRG